jgi:Fe2+ transport system protein FeoA
MTLHRIPEGTLIRILEVSVGHHLRRSLSQLGIQIGDIVHVQRHVPYGGPVLTWAGGWPKGPHEHGHMPRSRPGLSPLEGA